MNRNLIIAGVVILVILLAVFGFMSFSNGSKPSTLGSAEKSVSQNAVSSIQDMISKGASLECNYSTPEGIKIVAYIKNGMVRSDMTGKDTAQNGSTIVNTKDRKVYYWNGKTGYVMVIPNLSATPSADQAKVAPAQSNLAALEQYKSSCKPASVSDEHFVLPADVKFQDMSQMMPSSSATGSGKPQAYPSGTSEQQMKELMNRYKNPTQ